jgi:hypothetical protein
MLYKPTNQILDKPINSWGAGTVQRREIPNILKFGLDYSLLRHLYQDYQIALLTDPMEELRLRGV